MDNMFLLEVYEDSAVSTASNLFKRRIANSIDSIEDWMESNAQKWALLPVVVHYDDAYGNGTVSLKNDPDCVLYKFRTVNIGVI